MIQHEFEELLEQFSQDELNEKSTVKGQFTSYIIRRMKWHAIRYAAKNRPNVIVISLDQARDIWQILMPSKCFGRLRLNWLFDRKYRGFCILRFKMWRVRRMCCVGQWCHLCQDAKRNKKWGCCMWQPHFSIIFDPRIRPQEYNLLRISPLCLR